MKELRCMVEQYLDNAKPLFENLSAEITESIDPKSVSKDFEKMVLSYYSDSKHFFRKGEYAKSLAALEYAEGWLDAGKLLGIFRK